jgi:cytochrome c5
MLLLVVPVLGFANCGRLSDSMSPEAIMGRIKPIGTIEAEGGVIAGPATTVELSATAGEDRYKSSCSVCHDTGVGGAPKFRNKDDWKARMALGIDGLLQSAIKGKGAMPPKGTCMQCSDEELKLAIQHMLPK